LACTHFPLLKAELSQALPFVRHWIDSGDAVARRIESLLQAGKISTRFVQANTVGYFTASTKQSLRLIQVYKDSFAFSDAFYLTGC
jgi:glutamate racemase